MSGPLPEADPKRLVMVIVDRAFQRSVATRRNRRKDAMRNLL